MTKHKQFLMPSFIRKYFLVSAAAIALFSASANVSTFHPFYVSVTEMTYNAKTHSFEISCKMFAEDIEAVLKQNYKTAVDLGNAKMQLQNNKLMNDYMVKHLSVNVDAKALNCKYVGFEKEKESVYCYLEVTNVTALKKMTISNSVLYDFKQEEINIVHVIVNGNRQSSKLDYPQNEVSFSF